LPRHPPRPRPAASPRTERSLLAAAAARPRAATLALALTRSAPERASLADGAASAPAVAAPPLCRARSARAAAAAAAAPSSPSYPPWGVCCARARARSARQRPHPYPPSHARARHAARAQATQATDRALRPAAWAPARCAPPPAAPAPAPAPKRPFRGVSRVERICDYVRPCVAVRVGVRSKWKIGAPPAGASAARCRSRRVACVRHI